ncbi:hypothetical protein CPAV1605_1116 [seawater metagenome]|uniref:Uncharacterized protein n=1 Tax=seawater metagenome TaxID=1561972 RepID=A0A5E8CLV7_9ZZZZ
MSNNLGFYSFILLIIYIIYKEIYKGTSTIFKSGQYEYSRNHSNNSNFSANSTDLGIAIISKNNNSTNINIQATIENENDPVSYSKNIVLENGSCVVKTSTKSFRIGTYTQSDNIIKMILKGTVWRNNKETNKYQTIVVIYKFEENNIEGKHYIVPDETKISEDLNDSWKLISTDTFKKITNC